VSGSNGDRPVGADGLHEVPLPLEVHTQEQLDSYLEAVAQGIGLDLAARQIGSTGTRMRRLLARDAEWQARLDAAYAQGREHYADRLMATSRVIALRTDASEVIPRILEVELATHAPGYEHLRRDRIKHEGHVTHGVTVSVDPELLDALPLDQLQRARDALAVLAEVVDAEVVRELPAA
jgi:hypothetical protein